MSSTLLSNSSYYITSYVNIGLFTIPPYISSMEDVMIYTFFMIHQLILALQKIWMLKTHIFLWTTKLPNMIHAWDNSLVYTISSMWLIPHFLWYERWHNASGHRQEDSLTMFCHKQSHKYEYHTLIRCYAFDHIQVWFPCIVNP